MSDEKPGFEQRIVHALDDEVARLDEATRLRLRRARAQALHGRPRPARHARLWWASGIALASLMAVVVWWGGPGQSHAPSPGPADFELLTTKDSLELYRDLDFYLWLEREAGRAG
jgi:hypothetical protein